MFRERKVSLVLVELLDFRAQWDLADLLDLLELMVAR